MRKSLSKISGEAGYTKITVLITAAALAAAVWIGLKLPTESGLSLAVSSPLTGDELLLSASKLAFPDILSAAILSLPCGRTFSSLAGCAVFFLRGLVIGHTAMFCTVNSVSPAAVGALTAYCAVTLMLMLYAVLLTRGKREGNAVSGILCYLAVSGASVILRTVPYLFV